MDSRSISISIDGELKELDIYYKISPPFVFLEIQGVEFSAEADNLFECFIRLREKLPKVKFFCKGAKVNVHPSRMSSQMAAGLMAYELVLGKQALRTDMVNIFDYEDHDLTNDPLLQHDFFKSWIKSLREK